MLDVHVAFCMIEPLFAQKMQKIDQMDQKFSVEYNLLLIGQE